MLVIMSIKGFGSLGYPLFLPLFCDFLNIFGTNFDTTLDTSFSQGRSQRVGRKGKAPSGVTRCPPWKISTFYIICLNVLRRTKILLSLTSCLPSQR